MDLKSRFNGELGKGLFKYLKYKNDLPKNSTEYILLSKCFWHFFIGTKLAYKKTANKLMKKYWNSKSKCFVVGDIVLPYELDNSDADVITFWVEFTDLLLPYCCISKKTASFIYSEGPYEINKNVCLKAEDIVIDAGANMGLFSAVAASKCCKVYSFEPMPFVISKYLSKVASIYENINICNYALSDKDALIEFEFSEENIAVSSAFIKKDNNTNKSEFITAQATSIDSFANKNNLQKVDFIKADIEGAERYMLKGAKNVLKDFAPKMSICTYHLPDDPVVLKELILDANPKYRIMEKYKKMYAYVPK